MNYLNKSKPELIRELQNMEIKLSNLEKTEEINKKLNKLIKALLKGLGKCDYIKIGRELGFIRKEFSQKDE